MHFDPATIIVTSKDELLVGKRIFNFLSQVKMSSDTEVEILMKWMNDYTKRGIPFIVTEYMHPTKKLINTLWKEEKTIVGIQSSSKIIYKGEKSETEK